MTHSWFAAATLMSVLMVPSASTRHWAAGQSTGSIAGIVIDDQPTPKAIRRAIVTVSGATLGHSRNILTDDDGRFVLGGLPEGSYSLSAARAGFVTSAYGALRPARPGRPISVGAGEKIRDLSIRLWRAASLAGRIIDERGQPAAGVVVRAYSVRSGAATYQTLSNNGVSTDADGRFRIFGLAPADYVVGVSVGTLMSASAASVLQDRYVDRALEQLRRAMPAGVPTAPPVQLETLPRTLAGPIYYPGVPSRDDATPITLSAGQEAAIEITWSPTPVAAVAGIVTWPDGRPAAGATVRVARVARNGDLSLDGRLNTTSRGDGAFELPLLNLGDYRLSATVGTGADRPWAVARFSVGSSEVPALSLRLGPAITIHGRVEWQSESDPSGPAGVSVALVEGVSPGEARGTLARLIGGAALGSDGTFTLTGLQPDMLHSLLAHGIPNGWALSSATLGSSNLLDGPVSLSQGLAEQPLIIRVADRPAAIYGTLTGDPSAGLGLIVAFPQDPTLRRSAARVSAVQPDANGGYRIPNVIPGQYFVGVAIDADPDDWRDLTFLERLAAVATKVTVARGDRVRLDLRAGASR